MLFWEQFALGFVITLLHALKLDPVRVPVLRETLTVIYDGIGELMGWATSTTQPTTTPASAPPNFASVSPPSTILP